MPKDVKYNMSKSCYLCFKTKRVLVELIVGISHARTSKKSHVRELKKVMRARRKSHAYTIKQSNVHEQKVTCTRAKDTAHTNRRSRAYERKSCVHERERD